MRSAGAGEGFAVVLLHGIPGSGRTPSLRQLAELYRPVEDALGAISVPTLVGWGDHDPFFPVEQGRRTAEAVPGAELRLYEGAGHFLPEERPEELAADIALLVAEVRR